MDVNHSSIEEGFHDSYAIKLLRGLLVAKSGGDPNPSQDMYNWHNRLIKDKTLLDAAQKKRSEVLEEVEAREDAPKDRQKLTVDDLLPKNSELARNVFAAEDQFDDDMEHDFAKHVETQYRVLRCAYQVL